MRTVLFLCPYGGAKSVIAASFFNRLMEDASLPFTGVAAAAEAPYETVPESVADLLETQGFDVREFKPHIVETNEIRGAAKIVSIDCDLSSLDLSGSEVERWDDVPQASVDLMASSRAIRKHVEALASELSAGGENAQGQQESPSLRALVLYFLRLGTLGFGGPIALAGAMQRDLVEQRGWVSEDEYKKGLALAQLAPGPLAAQLAIYLGWSRSGIPGATLVALAFILPSFLMVLGISAAYVRFGGLAWMQSAFYGIGAAVIAIILRSAFKLVRLTLARDVLLWVIFAANAIATAAMGAEVVSLILAAGLVTLAVRTGQKRDMTALALIPPLAVVTGGVVSPALAGSLFWFFAKAGAFVFGSGLAIVPFLYGGVVREHQWLTDQQFLDAVAVAMITPGPVVITVAFIGYLVAGMKGAVLASLGVFLPCYLFVILPAPYYARFAGNPRLKAFVAGVTAAATGAIAGAVFVLGRRAIIDIPTALIFAGTMACLVFLKRMPEPLVIALVGIGSVLLVGL